MTNIGPDGCDARDTASEEPRDDRDVFVAAYALRSGVVRVIMRQVGELPVSFYLDKPDAQLLARSIYDVLEGQAQ